MQPLAIFLLIPFIVSASAPQPKSLTSDRVLGLSEVVLDSYPELIFDDLRFQLLWNDDEALAYILGTLLSKHIEFQIEGRRVSIDTKRVLGALKEISCEVDHDDPRRNGLGSFVNRSLDIDNVRKGFVENRFWGCGNVHTAIFASSWSIYPSVALSVALLKSLSVGKVTQKTEALNNLEVLPLQSMMSLLHFPKISKWVRPELINLVSHAVNLGNDCPTQLKDCFFASLATLPDNEPVKEVLVSQFLGMFRNNELIEFLIHMEPICSNAVKQRVANLIETKKVDVSLINARFRALFCPLVNSGTLDFKFEDPEIYSYTTKNSYSTMAKLEEGKTVRKFRQAFFFFRSTVSLNLENVSDAELFTRDDYITLVHSLPLKEAFTEKLRNFIDGKEIEKDPEFFYTLNAAGVTIFKSKALN